MEKNIKYYLHLYLGCEAISYYRTIDGRTGEEIVVELNKELIGVDMYGNAWLSGNLRISDFKLILRPLSDMTEKEVDELWQVLQLNPDFENDSYGFKKSAYLLEYFNCKEVFPAPSQRFDFKQSNLIFKFLLSKHFDLFGLIPAGLAIDKSTL